MSDVPNLTPQQVEAAIAEVSNVQLVGAGGQKQVFRGDIAGAKYAVKFAKTPEELDDFFSDDEQSEDDTDPEVIVRARREVETMRDCDSPHMVKLGPIGLMFTEIEGQNLLYFTEEFIDGDNLANVLTASGPLFPRDVVALGTQMAEAIEELWEIGKIHRDIKPANIMRRQVDGSFVLLDAGFAFDVVGQSLSGGMIVGTQLYFSPEQFDYGNRRTGMDFRSDMFSLGVAMYQLLTDKHPFWTRGQSSNTFYNNICNQAPEPPSSHKSGIPRALDDIVIRMLGKSPHLRYRKCSQLIDALESVEFPS